MLNVETIMQSKPKTVSPDMTLTNLEQLFLSTKLTGFPVIKEGRLVGVVSRSDIIRSLVTERSRAEQLSDFYCGAQLIGEEGPTQCMEATAAQVGVRLADQCVEDAMVRNVVSIDSAEPVRHLAQLMVEGHLHRLPVVNGDKLVGIVSTMDLARAVSEGHLIETDEAADPQVLLR